MRGGSYWLSKAGTALKGIVSYMALEKYAGVPDVTDRIADALAGVIEAAEGFKPLKGKDTLGYFLHYAVAWAAGNMRSGASQAKSWADESISFCDIVSEEMDEDPTDWLRDDLEVIPLRQPEAPAPSKLGVKYLWSDDPEDDRLVLKSGDVVTRKEYLELVTQDEKRSRIAANILGVDRADLDLALDIALDQVVDGLRYAPGQWTIEPGFDDRMVDHDLKDIEVIRTVNGTQFIDTIGAGELRQMVEDASEGTTPWMESNHPYVPRYDDSVIERPVNAMGRDTHTWPPEVLDLWSEAREAWENVEDAEVALRALFDDVYLEEDQMAVVETMETLLTAAVELSEDEFQEQSWLKSISRSLAERVAAASHLGWSEAQDSFEEYFGVDGDWEPQLPDKTVLKNQVLQFFEYLEDRDDIYQSQIAALKAMVLEGASPKQAKKVASEAFFSQHGRHYYASA